MQCAAVSVAQQQQTSIVASLDNSLFESGADPGDQLSSGVGESLFAGRTGQFAGSLRRALIRFDVGSVVPAGATIESVDVRLQVTRLTPGSGPRSVSIHRVSTPWGEGNSSSDVMGGAQGAPATIGDATWHYANFDSTEWTAPGGDFAADTSATASTDGLGVHTWTSTPALLADVQGWLAESSTNFGWILIGDESTAGTARRFASRESSDAQPPTLTITFSLPQACCVPVGTCMNVSIKECNVLGGTSQGVGSVCNEPAICCLPAGACDDANVCTTDSCQASSCVHTTITGCTPCATRLDCDDSNPCTDFECSGGRCTFTNSAVTCDDGDDCTTGDACANGECQGVTVPECRRCADADECDDGNVCTNDSCSNGGACQFTTNQALCNDGDPCTVDDVCTEGECMGTAMDPCCTVDDDCADNNACTDGACVENQCFFTPNTDDCDDADVCTENDLCSDGRCSGTPIAGCCESPEECDDADPCTGDSCTNGRCAHVQIEACVPCGDISDCDDGNECTDQSCAAGVCVVQQSDGPCDDGDPCTIDDACVDGTCIGTDTGACCTSDQQCDDDDECTRDVCDGGDCIHESIAECDRSDDEDMRDPSGGDGGPEAGAPNPGASSPPPNTRMPCGLFGLMGPLLLGGCLLPIMARRGLRILALLAYSACAAAVAQQPVNDLRGSANPQLSAGDSAERTDYANAAAQSSPYHYVETKKCQSGHSNWHASAWCASNAGRRPQGIPRAVSPEVSRGASEGDAPSHDAPRREYVLPLKCRPRCKCAVQ